MLKPKGNIMSRRISTVIVCAIFLFATTGVYVVSRPKRDLSLQMHSTIEDDMLADEPSIIEEFRASYDVATAPMENASVFKIKEVQESDAIPELFERRQRVKQV